jgi:hypothetical protein
MKTKSKKKQRQHRKLLQAGFIPCVHARSLIGKTMLILALKPIEGHPYAKFVVHARLKNRLRLYFPAGVVVEQQIKETPLPVWAKLLWREGIKHPYYILELARTISVERAATPQP